jgi:prepilin-type N-terminal cleavage/methylation domain-containing protein
MHKSNSGFTIVELLLVIVVIGILSAITIQSFSNIQRRAANTVRVNEIFQWVKSFQLYKAAYGSFPQNPSTATGYCLGTGFPEGGTCGDIYWAPNAYKENATLMNEIKTISNLPSGPRNNPVNAAIGPFVVYEGNYLDFIAVLSLPGNERCTDFGLLERWRDSAAGTSFCGIETEY